MSVTKTTPTQQIDDTVPKINDELAVGEDLDFQQKWWGFEKGVWICLTILVLLDIAGAFGRGPLANAEARSADGDMYIRYERVERFNTPSILRIDFDASAIENGRVKLWVGDQLLRALGNQRIVPQPVSSEIGAGGVLYTFEAGRTPASVAFALEPASPGLRTISLSSAPASGASLEDICHAVG